MLQKKVLSETHSMKTVPLRTHHYNSKLTFYNEFLLHCHSLSFGCWCPIWLNFYFHSSNPLFFPLLWGLGGGICFLSELKMEGVRETMWIQQSDENRVEHIPLKIVVSVNPCFHERAFAVNIVCFDYFWAFFFLIFLRATTCSKWRSCLCAGLALVLFKKKTPALLLFCFNMLGQ